MFTNISNVNGHTERDGSSAHNVGSSPSIPEGVAQHNENTDALNKSLPIVLADTPEDASSGFLPEENRAVTAGAHSRLFKPCLTSCKPLIRKQYCFTVLLIILCEFAEYQSVHQVLAEAQQVPLPCQQPAESSSQLVNSANSPSPSFDSSGSAGQTEVDSEFEGANHANQLRFSGESLLAAQQRQIAAAAASKERRRRQILPKIARGDRCGECHHCRNPKLKKACITARKLQMQSLDDKEELPLFYKIADNKLNNKAVPPVRPKLPAISPQQIETRMLIEQIQAFIINVDNQVMIKPGKQHHFVDLMHRPQMTWAVRLFFLTTIVALPTTDRTMLVTLADRKGLLALHSWLKSATERAAQAEKFQLDVLKALGVLPVDMAALKQVAIGKTVNGLAKRDPSPKVKAAAAKVVQQWRRNVGMADSDAKRARLFSDGLVCIFVCGALP